MNDSNQPVAGRGERKSFRYWAVITLLAVVTLPVAIVWFPSTFLMATAWRIAFRRIDGQWITHQEARRIIAQYL